MDLANDEVSKESDDGQRTGEDYMAVNNKELEDMKELEQKNK